MPDRARLFEVRLLVVVTVDVTNPELIEMLQTQHPSSVADVVASEVRSNLESVPYVGAAIVTAL